MPPQSVTIHTDDDVDLAADWYPVTGAKRFAILLHMRPATKESWKAWAAALNAKGVSCLAFDQRGHGGSTQGGTLDYRTAADDRAKRLDVDAAFEWLRDGEGAKEDRLVLVGASIGANLAIRFAAERAAVPLVIALSPGTDYRGVSTDDVVAKLAPAQRVILVASDDDDFASGESCRKLHALAPDRTVLVEKKGLGHGTGMTDKDPGLIAALLAYLP